ncbi:MAG: C_GCAxxG_C_C family protein [Oscillospiraceae bacterium]|jgi:C_GCAxxG_C_C family probable redox protein
MQCETKVEEENQKKSKCVSHRERAMQLFEQGYNCSQSVFAAFSEELGLDVQTALKLASSFGGGMGRLREVCGAVTGMFMAVGLKYGYTGPNAMPEKTKHYERIQALAKRFEKENGSIICRELLGLDVKYDDPKPQARTKEYYQSRPCSELVGAAAQMLDEFFAENHGKATETHKENS